MSGIDDLRAGSTFGSAKEKNAVRKAVTALLDELAPERVARAGKLRLPVERYRTPNGCVIQAGTAALTVSWFAPSDREPTDGELRVIVWRGQVTRRGSDTRAANPTTVSETILHPITRPGDTLGWRDTNGGEFDTSALAAHCLELLNAQIAGG